MKGLWIPLTVSELLPPPVGYVVTIGLQKQQIAEQREALTGSTWRCEHYLRKKY